MPTKVAPLEFLLGPPSRVQALGEKVADVALRMSGLRVVSLEKL